jgi:hypothetical protein
MHSEEQRFIFVTEVGGKKIAIDPIRVHRKYVRLIDPELEAKLATLSGEQAEAAEERAIQAVRTALEMGPLGVSEDGTVTGYSEGDVLQVWTELQEYMEGLKKNMSPSRTSPCFMESASSARPATARKNARRTSAAIRR